MTGAFLWHGSTEGSHSARVSWETITLSKTEGGLGCRDLQPWNKACTLKLIWLLFSNAGSIWVAWFREEILSGELSNFWTLKESRKYSWYVNKLLSYRDEVYNWIKKRVGSGETTYFWTDNWSPFGKLLYYLHPRASNSMGVPLNAKLSDLCINGSWTLRSPRSEKQLQVQCFISSITLDASPDRYEWEAEGVIWHKYQTGAMYNLLKRHVHVVPWHPIVWIKSGIPRQSFQVWLAVLNRMPTRDRLLSWNIATTSACLLCNVNCESRDHLYFACPYAWEIWSLLAPRCEVLPLADWESTIAQMTTLSGPQWKRTVTLLVWQHSIYSIWMERNSRLHRSIFKSSANVIACIDFTIRNRIQAIRETNPSKASLMMQFWLASAP